MTKEKKETKCDDLITRFWRSTESARRLGEKRVDRAVKETGC